jgi:hypothetical protein
MRLLTSYLARVVRHTDAGRAFDASVDPTEARKATVRRFGRSDRRAQERGCKCRLTAPRKRCDSGTSRNPDECAPPVNPSRRPRLRSRHGRRGMNRGPRGGIGRRREPCRRLMVARQADACSLSREPWDGVQLRGQKFDFGPPPGSAGFSVTDARPGRGRRPPSQPRSDRARARRGAGQTSRRTRRPGGRMPWRDAAPPPPGTGRLGNRTQRGR